MLHEAVFLAPIVQFAATASMAALRAVARDRLCQADPAGHAPVHSDIPTLIVTGQYDPPTPPAYGRLAAATLTRSYFTEFPGLAHIPRDPCVDDVKSAFVYQPLHRPDTSCIQQMPPISWETG